MRCRAIAAAAAVGAVNAVSLPRDSCPPLSVNYTAPIPAQGYTYRLVAHGLTKPRSIAFDDAGALLVVDSGVGVVRMTTKDNGGTCVVVGAPQPIINSTELNHGLAISSDGKTLYASSSSAVYAWPYDSKSGNVTGQNITIVTDLADSDKGTRTLLVSQKKKGMLLVSRGTVDDDDEQAKTKSSGHAQIRAFDASSSHRFVDGVLLGWGLRNSVGLAEHPAGGIWSVENSIDELTRDGSDIHPDNPAEELNYHGSLNDSSTASSQGGNYGFPLCYALWNTTGFPDLGSLVPGDQFPGPDAKTFTDETCNKDYVAPKLALPAHTAPLDIVFNKDGSRAYISFHGSFATKNPVGYRIASVDFDSSGQPKASHSSTDAAVDVLTTPDLANCPDGCLRPVGLAWDSKDRLWFSSDSTGEIFVLMQNETTGSGSAGTRLAVSKTAAWVVGLAAAAVLA